MATLKANGGALYQFEKHEQLYGKTAHIVIARCNNGVTLGKRTVTYNLDGRQLKYGWTRSGLVYIQSLTNDQFVKGMTKLGWTRL